MSAYPPPIEDLPFFNPAVFTVLDIPLTVAEGEKYFLKYPQAQGTQSFTDINVGGIATIEDVKADSLEVANNTTLSGALEVSGNITGTTITGINGRLDDLEDEILQGVVHIEGTETITGDKTLSGTTTFTGNIVADSITLTPTELSYVDGATSNIQTQLNTKASITYVDDEITDAINALIDSAPSTLVTLNELAAALGDDPNFATTIATQLGLKANDVEVVHKTGTEEITGAKTFTNDNFSVKNGTGSDKIILNGATTTLTNDYNNISATIQNNIGNDGDITGFVNNIVTNGTNSRNLMTAIGTGSNNVLTADSYNQLKIGSAEKLKTSATTTTLTNDVINIDGTTTNIQSGGTDKIKVEDATTTLTNNNINVNGATTFTEKVKIYTGDYTSAGANALSLFSDEKYGFGIAVNTLKYLTHTNHKFYSGSTSTSDGTLKLSIENATTTLTNGTNTLTATTQNYIEATGTSAYNKIYASGAGGYNLIESKRTNNTANDIYASASGGRNIIRCLPDGYNEITVGSSSKIKVESATTTLSSNNVEINKAQNTDAFTNPHLKLTNTANTNDARASIAMATSTNDGYGVSLSAQRVAGGLGGAPAYDLRLHFNSASGVSKMYVTETDTTLNNTTTYIKSGGTEKINVGSTTTALSSNDVVINKSGDCNLTIHSTSGNIPSLYFIRNSATYGADSQVDYRLYDTGGDFKIDSAYTGGIIRNWITLPSAIGTTKRMKLGDDSIAYDGLDLFCGTGTAKLKLEGTTTTLTNDNIKLSSPYSVRYIKLFHSIPNTIINLAELEAYTADGTNVASGKTVTSSVGWYGTNTGDKLVNGIYTDYAHTAVVTSSNIYMLVDLGANYPITSVKIWNRDAGVGTSALRAIGIEVQLLNASSNVLRLDTIISNEPTYTFTYSNLIMDTDTTTIANKNIITMGGEQGQILTTIGGTAAANYKELITDTFTIIANNSLNIKSFGDGITIDTVGGGSLNPLYINGNDLNEFKIMDFLAILLSASGVVLDAIINIILKIGGVEKMVINNTTTTLTNTSLVMKTNAGGFKLKGDDHLYIEFYPDNSIRRAYLGYPNSGSQQLVIANQYASDIVLATSGANKAVFGVDTTTLTNDNINVNGVTNFAGQITGEFQAYFNKRVFTYEQYIRLGSIANFSFIDYRSGGNSADYDVRVSSTGGTSAIGYGGYDIDAGTIQLSSKTSNTLRVNGTEKLKTDATTTTLTNTTVNIASDNIRINNVPMCNITLTGTNSTISARNSKISWSGTIGATDRTESWSFPFNVKPYGGTISWDDDASIASVLYAHIGLFRYGSSTLIASASVNIGGAPPNNSSKFVFSSTSELTSQYAFSGNVAYTNTPTFVTTGTITVNNEVSFGFYFSQT